MTNDINYMNLNLIKTLLIIVIVFNLTFYYASLCEYVTNFMSDCHEIYSLHQTNESLLNPIFIFKKLENKALTINQ